MSQMKIDVSSLSPALQTAFSYLAEGNWRNANDCFDLALKASPLDPYACLGKAMTAACIKTPEELNYCPAEILDDPFFSAALKYAEDDLKNDLTQMVVRLNYDRQKAQAQRPAIETAQQAEQPLAAEIAEAVNAEETDPTARANWNMGENTDGTAAKEGESDKKDTPEETVDVVKGKKKVRKKLIAAVVIVLVVLLGAGGAGAYFYLIPLMKYNQAIDLINDKQYDEGLAILEELGDFSDAKEQYKTGLYVKGLNCLANNDFDSCETIFEELGDFKDSQELLASLDMRRVSLEIKTIAAASAGDIVTFGTFETDGNEENGPEALRWQVLNNRDDLVTLITEQSIAGMRFHFNNGQTSWAECSVRSWLNGTFFTSAFNVNEAGFVCKNYISTPANPDFPSPLGETTVDRVYLLSLSEALSCFKKLSDRKLTCTPASYMDTYTDDDGNCCWWLRTSGARLESAVGVDTTGQVMTVGYDCYQNDQIGVRPVIVIDISGVGGSASAPSEDEYELPEEPTELTTAPVWEGQTSETTTYRFPGAATTAPSEAATQTTVPQTTVQQTTDPMR